MHIQIDPKDFPLLLAAAPLKQTLGAQPLDFALKFSAAFSGGPIEAYVESPSLPSDSYIFRCF